MDEDRPDEQAPDTAPQPERSTRAWRSCCMVPALALAMILLIGFGASLFSPGMRTNREPSEPVSDEAAVVRRQAFIEFGKKYFAIAQDADQMSQTAFDALQSKMQGDGTLKEVHDAFRRAATANGKASAKFKSLEIPPNLASQDKIRRSVDIISGSYDTRREICELMVGWSGDANDRDTADRYNALAEEINRTTQEGLRYLGEAARDNKLTRDDVRKFLPASAKEPMRLDTKIWQ